MHKIPKRTDNGKRS